MSTPPPGHPGLPRPAWTSLAAFLALSLFAWTIWGAQAAHKYGLIGWAPSQQSPLNALTVWSPGLAAILLTGLASGKAAVGGLFRGLLIWRVPLRWYALALLVEPGRWLVALGIDRLLGRSYPLGAVPLAAKVGAAAPTMIPLALLFTLPNALGEELGWRGYALPRLCALRGPLLGSVVLGLFWGAWHVPMWLYWARSTPGALSLALAVANFVPTALIFTLIYLGSRRSLLLACLCHASMATKGYVCPPLPTLTETLVLWAIGVAIVVRGRLSSAPGVAADGKAGAVG